MILAKLLPEISDLLTIYQRNTLQFRRQMSALRANETSAKDGA